MKHGTTVGVTFIYMQLRDKDDSKTDASVTKCMFNVNGKLVIDNNEWRFIDDFKTTEGRS